MMNGHDSSLPAEAESDVKVFNFADGIASNDIGNDSIFVSASPIYMNELMRGLNTFRADSTLTDITLVVEKMHFAAHRMILAIHSDYFRAMLTSGMAETYSSTVELKDITLEGFKPVFDYMYQGTLDINDDNVNEVLGSAVQFQAAGAIRICCRWLKNEIKYQTGQRLVNAANLTELYSFEDLYISAKKALHKVFPDIVADGHYLSLSPATLEFFFKSPSKYIPSEEKLLEMACKWVDCDAENRVDYLDMMIKHVRFTQITSWPIQRLTEQYSYLSRSKVFEKQLKKKEAYSRLRIRERIFKQDENTELRGEPSIVAFCGKDKEASYKSENLFVLHRRPKQREQWIRACNTPESFSCVGTAVFNNFLFVCGGLDDEDCPQSSCYLFDPRSLQWTAIASMNLPRANFPVVSCGDQLYAFGGEDQGHTSMVEIESYSIKQNVWTELKANMLMRLHSHAACSINENIYISGGECPILNEDDDETSTPVENMVVFNTITSEWKELQPMYRHMSKHTMYVTDRGRIMAVCGTNTAIHEYDPVSDQWTIIELLHHAQNLKREMSPVLSVHSAFIDRHVFFINGLNHRCSVFSMKDHMYKEMDRYEDDVKDDVIVCVLTMPVHRLSNE